MPLQELDAGWAAVESS